jgi:hypothetical protein
MEKFMRNAPSFAVLVALIIQVDRVGAFGSRIGAGWLAWVFALFLASVIFVLSYWYGRTKYHITADANKPEDKAKYAQQKRMARIYRDARIVAGIWLSLFVAIDGSLNFFETMAGLPEGISIYEKLGAAVYGVFPTLAAFGLGSLQALIDRIPNGPATKSAAQVLFDNWMRRIETQSVAGPAQGANDAPHDAKYAPQSDAYPKPCPHGCGEQLHNAAQYSAHTGRWCKVIQARNAQNAQGVQVPVELPKMEPQERMRAVLSTTTTSQLEASKTGAPGKSEVVVKSKEGPTQ